MVKSKTLEKVDAVLRNVAADPEEQRIIEQEWLAMKDEEGYEQALKALEEKNKALAEKDKALEEKDKALEDKDKVIKELRRKLGL